MLQEDNISTALRGRSSFSWSCSLRRLQEGSLFFWEREGSVSEGRNEHQPCHLKCVLEEIPLVLDLRLQSCLMSRTGAVWMESLQGHPQALTGVVLLQPIPLESVSHEDLGRKCEGHAAPGGVTTVLSPSSRAAVYLWSWNLCLAVQGEAGLSDWPKAPDVLQDCQIGPKPLMCSKLLGADSLGQHHAPLWAPWTQTLSLGEV